MMWLLLGLGHDDEILQMAIINGVCDVDCLYGWVFINV